MKRRTVKLPVLNGNTAGWILSIIVVAIVALVATGTLDSPARILTAVNAMALPWAYSLYSLVRTGDHGGKPLEIGIGKKPLPVLTVTKIAPKRTPLAFPAKPGQCYVCSLPNPDYKEVFGTDAHATCEEWLGHWEPPIWNIYGEKSEKVRNPASYELHSRYGYTNRDIPLYETQTVTRHLGVLDGWKTPAEVEAWCLDFRVGDKRFTRAERAGYDNFGPTVINLTHLNKEIAR